MGNIPDIKRLGVTRESAEQPIEAGERGIRLARRVSLCVYILSANSVRAHTHIHTHIYTSRFGENPHS